MNKQFIEDCELFYPTVRNILSIEFKNLTKKNFKIKNLCISKLHAILRIQLEYKKVF